MDRDALFCVVDKAAGEDHSFVDGMLRGCVEPRCRVMPLVRSRRDGVRSARDAFEAPFRRRGFGRIGYALYALYAYLREFGVSSDCRVFIRNDVLTLCLFHLYRQLFRRPFDVIFQSSFPHEDFSSNAIARWISRRMLAYAVPRCVRILVVNEGAIPRLRRYSETVEIRVVPLCSDFKEAASRPQQKGGALSFVYVGTFDPARQLGVVLQAFARVSSRRDFVVNFIGGSRDDLCEDEATRLAVEALERKDMFRLQPRLSRELVREFIAAADVGLNLIPPIDVYKESSSTKLGEYLSQGVPVISSAGIPYHHQIHQFGSVGWLVDFDTSSIEEAVVGAIDAGREALSRYRDVCSTVVRERLRYEAYVDAVLS